MYQGALSCADKIRDCNICLRMGVLLQHCTSKQLCTLRSVSYWAVVAHAVVEIAVPVDPGRASSISRTITAIARKRCTAPQPYNWILNALMLLTCGGNAISFGGSCSDMVWKSSDCSVGRPHGTGIRGRQQHHVGTSSRTWLLPPQPTPGAVDPRSVAVENGFTCSGPKTWCS